MLCNAMLCYAMKGAAMSGNVVRNMPATQFTTNQTRKQARERAHLESRQACEPETVLCNAMLCYGRFTEAVDQASKEAEMKQASKQVGKQASEQARGRVILSQPIYVGGGYCMCAWRIARGRSETQSGACRKSVSRRCFSMQ